MQDDHAINYQPLAGDVSWQQAAKFKITRGALPVPALIGAAFGILFAIYFISKTPVIGLIVVLAMLGGLYAVYLVAKKKEVRFKAFAEANGFAYTSMWVPQHETSALFGFGHHKHAKRVVYGDYTYHFWFGTFLYSTGIGINSRTMKRGVMSIKLPRQFPHIMIDGRQMALGGLGGENLQRYEYVDGEFAQHYTVYYPAGAEPDLQHIVTPELMQTLVRDVRRKVDIEIAGDIMYIYLAGPFEPNENNVKSLFTILENLRV